jgi:hypothetical protein
MKDCMYFVIAEGHQAAILVSPGMQEAAVDYATSKGLDDGTKVLVIWLDSPSASYANKWFRLSRSEYTAEHIIEGQS